MYIVAKHQDDQTSPGEEFLFEENGRRVSGRATVAEVDDCVFVFTIYTSGSVPSHMMVVKVKGDSPQVTMLRQRCLPATEADMMAYQRWLKIT